MNISTSTQIYTLALHAPTALCGIGFAFFGATTPEPPAENQGRQQSNQRDEEHAPGDPPGDVAGPRFGGEGEIGGAVGLVEAGEGARALVGYKERPEQDEHGP